MAEEEAGRSSTEDRKATENVLTQKFGPLPLFVWVALGAGILGAFILLKKKGGGAAAATPVANGIAGNQGSGGSSDSGGSSVDTSQFASAADFKQLQSDITGQLGAIQGNETALGQGIANTNSTLTQTQAGLSNLGNTVNGLNVGGTGATGASRADLASLANEVAALAGSGSFAGQSSVAAIGQNAANIGRANSGAVNSGTSILPGTPVAAPATSNYDSAFNVLTANNGSPAAGVSRGTFDSFTSQFGRAPNDAYELAKFAGK